ncbi:MAG TPA: Hsp20/alpha crystallin family protein [Labilithrix sp.]|nr:Hsp20/alpha crystallin family protein [Labilithrix sp.]
MLTAWNAFPMLDSLFDDVMHGVAGTALGTAATQRSYSPAIDVRTNADEIVFVCDVPGIKHEDLDVSVEAGRLTIKGHRRYEGGQKDQVWLGRSYGAFERSFTLPDLVDPDKLTADLSDGVLTIRVPKKPQAKPRRIQIAVDRGHTQLGERSD